MSGQKADEREQNKVPIGVVFIVIGFIFLATVLAVWIVAPVYMPQPLYDVVGDFLQETGIPFPTPAAAAAVPEPVGLLPETPAQTEEGDLPDYFVSVAEAAKREPDEGIPLRIVIPEISLDAPVGSVSLEKFIDGDETYYQWPVPNTFMAGWHDNSARLGQFGNTVLNGHHNVHGEIFRDLVDLEVGDEIVLYDSRSSYAYRVTAVERLAEQGQPMSVRMENAQWIAATTDERITLVTCWPYTANTHRLIVVAKPVKDGV